MTYLAAIILTAFFVSLFWIALGRPLFDALNELRKQEAAQRIAIRRSKANLAIQMAEMEKLAASLPTRGKDGKFVSKVATNG